MSTQIGTAATDKKTGMTLGELQAFIDSAFRAGLPVNVPVRAIVGFKGQLQKISADQSDTT